MFVVWFEAKKHGTINSLITLADTEKTSTILITDSKVYGIGRQRRRSTKNGRRHLVGDI